MEGKFSYAGIDENKKGDDKQRKNILQIKKYDSQSLIFNDNDSFIANEKQAMREDVESEFENGADSNGQELQNEIDQLKIDLDEAIEAKSDALSQLALKDKEIEKLNDIVRDLKSELQNCQEKNTAINKELSEQRELNSGLSLRLQELTEALSDKGASLNDEKASNPDQLIYRVRALELQLKSSKNENDKLKEEIENHKNHYIAQTARLTQEISNVHIENLSNEASISDSSYAKSLENEIAALRSQLDMMTESQKSLTDSLQNAIDAKSRLNAELSVTQENLKKNINENVNNSTVITNLLEITNLSDPFDLIINVKRLLAEKDQAEQATQQLCQMQISYGKLTIINEKLKNELSELKDRFLEEISNKSERIGNEIEKETSNPSFDQNFINDLKSDYESRLTAERERTLSQIKKIDAIKRRDRQIADKLASSPERVYMIQSLTSIFESLSENTDSIINSSSDVVEGINDNLLNEAINEAQEIAVKLVPHDYLFTAVTKLKLYQDYLDEIFAKEVEFSGLFKGLTNKVENMQRILRRTNQRNSQYQRIARMPISSKFNNRSDVTIMRNTNNNVGNNDSTFDFNLNPNHSSLSFSRSPVAGGTTPKSGMRRIPFTDKGNGINQSLSSWKPRSSPSNEFGPPNTLF